MDNLYKRNLPEEAAASVRRRKGFTAVPNSVLRDKRLSLKARAVLAIMATLPEDWDFTVSGLAVLCGAGRDAIRSALRELEEHGYLTRVQRHDASGHFGRNEYIITDEPAGRNEPPRPDFPLTGEPLPGNPTQQKKDPSNPPYSPPAGEADTPNQPSEKREVDWALFERFWQAYPQNRRKKKASARRAWRKLNPELSLCRAMAAALERDRRSRDWQREDGAYIPYPASWLNGRRWEDEPDEEGGGGAPLRGEGVSYT